MSGRRFLAMVAAFSLLLTILLLTPAGTKLQSALSGGNQPGPGNAGFPSGQDGETLPLPSKTMRPDLQPIPSTEAYIQGKLDRIIIPVVDFENTTVEEAMDFIRQRCRELDPEREPAKRGISFVIRKSRIESASPAIDAELDAESSLGAPDPGAIIIKKYYARDVSAAKVLDEICRHAGLRWSVGERGILFVPDEKIQ